MTAPAKAAPMREDVTRPIVGIENRTAQEVFDIMADRFRLAHTARPDVYREAYDELHEIAVGLGYPSVLEALETLSERPDAGDGKGARGNIDWTMPLEAVHSDGRIVATTVGSIGPDGLRRSDQVLDTVNRLFHEDGSPWTASGWRIRNIRRPDAGDEDVERVAAEAIRSAFFTSVSGEKPHRYHLSLAYPTMDAMHEAEDAIKAWAKSVLEPKA